MRGRCLRLLLAFVFLTACQSAQKRPVNIAVPENILTKTVPTVVLDHGYYKIYYSPKFNLAKYVRYSLTADQLKSRSAKRKNKFFKDPFLAQMKISSVSPTAYAKSGYHRGHLAPAEDFRFSQKAIDATFAMSNMVPQEPGLNTGPWKKLEQLVRRWACGEEKVTVITGPVLEDSLARLPTGVAIPREFFKLVIDETPPRKAMAFILRQEDRGNVLRERIASDEEVKRKTQEDFLAELRAEEQNRKPAQVNAWREADCD